MADHHGFVGRHRFCATKIRQARYRPSPSLMRTAVVSGLLIVPTKPLRSNQRCCLLVESCSIEGEPDWLSLDRREIDRGQRVCENAKAAHRKPFNALYLERGTRVQQPAKERPSVKRRKGAADD
jgi:hypothetical protein